MKTFKQEIRTIILWMLAILITLAVGMWMADLWIEADGSAEKTIASGSCNIAVVPVVGEILPYPEASQSENENTPQSSTNPDDTLRILREAEENSDIRGVLVRIDSGGGSPVPSQIIANSLKRSSLPVVALVREMGTSGAYWIATGAKTIIASPISDIGSIGVTMSYLDYTKKNTKEGLQYVSLSSAKFKDYGDADKTLTDPERALYERDLQIIHKQFVKEVAENRKLPVAQVAKLADGSSMPGTLALENKLIDQLGDQETARAWFAKELKIPTKEIVFCE
ncbi:MAG: signal peptide peptidase SppA [Candidatus Vogelbacteria bacterium]|nr:signal peptide peptidase SppA [Candidatus Vogelbacteria bacterium]